MRCFFRGDKGAFERLAVWCEHAAFAVVAVLLGLGLSLASCPQNSLKPVSSARVKIRATTPISRPMRAVVKDYEREFQEDDHEPSGLPGVPAASSTLSLVYSQFTPPQSVYFSLLTAAQRPLRC
jgi:hypothetical protein